MRSQITDRVSGVTEWTKKIKALSFFGWITGLTFETASTWPSFVNANPFIVDRTLQLKGNLIEYSIKNGRKQYTG